MRELKDNVVSYIIEVCSRKDIGSAVGRMRDFWGVEVKKACDDRKVKGV